MRVIKILLILLVVSFYNANGQNRENHDYSFSFYSSLQFSKGMELRGEFTDWYMSFQAENFLKDKQYFFNWGGAVGIMKQEYNFDYLAGIRVGFMTIEDTKKPLIGLEAEIDYKVSESVYIGLRATYDQYFDSPTVEDPTGKEMLRGFVKIGYKF